MLSPPVDIPSEPSKSRRPARDSISASAPWMLSKLHIRREILEILVPILDWNGKCLCSPRREIRKWPQRNVLRSITFNDRRNLLLFAVARRSAHERALRKRVDS